MFRGFKHCWQELWKTDYIPSSAVFYISYNAERRRSGSWRPGDIYLRRSQSSLWNWNEEEDCEGMTRVETVENGSDVALSGEFVAPQRPRSTYLYYNCRLRVGYCTSLSCIWIRRRSCVLASRTWATVQAHPIPITFIRVVVFCISMCIENLSGSLTFDPIFFLTFHHIFVFFFNTLGCVF